MSATMSKYYWRCQLLGWSALLVGLIIIYGFYGFSIREPLILVFSGLLATHLLRNAILRYQWLHLPFRVGLTRLFFGALAACTIASLIRTLAISFFPFIFSHHRGLAFPRLLYLGALNYTFVVIPWTMIYASYYYMGRLHRQELEKRRLETKLEKMRLESEGSGVDMDTIMNTLSRIQKSIDENPDRSRAEITEFSNLLRKGYLTFEK